MKLVFVILGFFVFALLAGFNTFENKKIEETFIQTAAFASNRDPVQIPCNDSDEKRCSYGNNCYTGAHTCDNNPCPPCSNM